MLNSSNLNAAFLHPTPPHPLDQYPFDLGRSVIRRLSEQKNGREFTQQLLAEAARYDREPLPPITYSLFQLFEETGARDQYELAYFSRRGRLAAYTIRCLLAEAADPAAFRPLEEAIWDMCGEYTWCLPAHLSPNNGLAAAEQVDLFAAETAHSLAEVLYLLEDRLSPRIKQLIRREIERRVFRPIFTLSHSFGWETATHNWSAVCAGSVGMAAILLVDDRQQLTSMLDRLLPALDCFLSGYGDDGGCAEGVGYWEYGFGYYVYFAEMLYAFTGGTINLLGTEKARAISGFPAKVNLSADCYANYSDSPEKARLHPGLLTRLLERTGSGIAAGGLPGFHDDHCYRWAPFIRNLAWSRMDDAAMLTAALGANDTAGKTIYFTDLHWLVDKRIVSGKPVAFSAKGGHNEEPHNHNDLGHFILHAVGINLLNDLGHGLYTKDYFGSGRYQILNNSSAGHSVPVINGLHQGDGPQYKAGVLGWQELSDGAAMQLDLTEAYPKAAGLEGFIRSFRWQSSGPAANICNLILTDELQFRDLAAAGNVEERFISSISPYSDASSVTWSAPGAAHLTVEFDPEVLAVEIEHQTIAGHAGEPIDVFITKLRLLHPTKSCKLELPFTLNLI
ncbi:hypothetical protein [Gorillibacterium massiliense]|uniref:hypothetical protein n=1 Tax=Gorillibacterium massiliense TaxID=1280390 RepID=UPI0004B6B80E|nr:hypothetical protein [Gorillibacterium massiliense]